MEVIIHETGERKNLEIRDERGTEWTADLLGNYGIHADNHGYVTLSQADYDWWHRYIQQHMSDMDTIRNIAAKLGRSPSDLLREIATYLKCDLEGEHDAIMQALDAIREGATYV